MGNNRDQEVVEATKGIFSTFNVVIRFVVFTSLVGVGSSAYNGWATSRQGELFLPRAEYREDLTAQSKVQDGLSETLKGILEAIQETKIQVAEINERDKVRAEYERR